MARLQIPFRILRWVKDLLILRLSVGLKLKLFSKRQLPLKLPVLILS